MSRFRGARTALVLSVLLMALAIGGLAATASTASAASAECTRSGDTLSWTSIDETVQIRGFDAPTGEASTWLASVQNQDNSYTVTAADMEKAPGDRYFIRYRTGGETFESPCNANDVTPPDAITCIQDGSQLTWDQLDVSNDVFFVREVNADGSSSFVAAVDASNANSFDGASPSESYIIRYRITFTPGDTQTFDVPCDENEITPPDAITCAQDGSELTWDQLDVSRDVFFVRQVNADGRSSFVAAVDASNPNSFNGASPSESYIIRYRITFTPGDTQTFDVPCNQVLGPPPPDGPIACSTSRFGFLQETGFDVTILGAVEGESFTLFLNGEVFATTDEPLELVPFIGQDENEYFRVDDFLMTFFEVEVARTDDLDTRFDCGTTGEPRVPVTACEVVAGDDGTVELFTTPQSFTNPFVIEVDGVATEREDFRPDFPGAPVIFYIVEGSLTSEFTVVQEAGTIDCTGDDVFAGEPSPVTACEVVLNEFSEIDIVVTPAVVSEFLVNGGGAGLFAPLRANTPEFPANAPPTSYSVQGGEFDSYFVFNIGNDAGAVECTGIFDIPFSCTHTNGNLEWDAAFEFDGDYNVRRYNSDGSSSWVLTTSETSAQDVGEGSFFIVTDRVGDELRGFSCGSNDF